MVKVKNPKMKAPVAKQSFDDFLATLSDDDDGSDNEIIEKQEKVSKKGMNGHQKKGKKPPTPPSSSEDEEDESEAGSGASEVDEEEFENEENGKLDNDGSGEDLEESDTEETSKTGARQQKKYIASLKDKDPEFFKFLKENDAELLNFDESSSDEDDGDEEEKVHKPPNKLEVASDESDYDSDQEEESTQKSKKSNVITKTLLEEWSNQLTEKPTVPVIAEVVGAFKSAVNTIGISVERDNKDSKENGKKFAGTGKYLVEGTASFNGIVRLCLTKLQPAFNKILGIAQSDTSRKALHPQRCKTWSKVNKHLKSYTLDLVKLLSNINTGSVQSALLKHVQNIVPFFAALPKNSKLLTKCLVNLWSTANEETVRVLSFMCLIRMTRLTSEVKPEEGDTEFEDKTSLLQLVIKQMYMAYVRNSKFTSPSAWPMINFMRRSLAEIFNLNHQVAYRYAFIYIRQLSIHLRNAMMQHKGKESIETVYNWQFVHCTHLWTQLLTESHPSEVLEPLIHPLVQVISGAIRLCYTPKYYPIRFHFCQQLIRISSETEKFIPILPFYLDILNNYNFGRKSSKLSMKPMDFSCCLKVSKSQLAENGFKDSTIEQIYCGLLDYLQSVSHKISFPELVVPLTFQLKQFHKACKASNYVKKMKQVMDKTIESGKFIIDKRKKVTFGVRDLDEIGAWELGVKTQGTPLSKFYQSFRKVKEHEQKKEMTQKDKLDDYDFVPTLKKNKTQKKKSGNDFKGLLEGSDDDDTDDEDDVERFKLREERGKKRKVEDEDEDEDLKAPKKKKETQKPKKKVKEPEMDDEEDEDDIVEELDINDLGSEDEGSEIEDSNDSDVDASDSDEDSDD